MVSDIVTMCRLPLNPSHERRHYIFHCRYGVTRAPLCLYVVAARICTFEELSELSFGGVVAGVVLSRRNLRWDKLLCTLSAPADKELWALTNNVPFFKLSPCDFSKNHQASLWIRCSQYLSLSYPGVFSFGPSSIGRMCKFPTPLSHAAQCLWPLRQDLETKLRPDFVTFCFTCGQEEAATLEGRLTEDLAAFFSWLNHVVYSRGWGCERKDFPIVVLGSPAQMDEMLALVLVKLTTAMGLSLRTVSEMAIRRWKICPL